MATASNRMKRGKSRRLSRYEVMAEELHACEIELRERAVYHARRSENDAARYTALAADRVHQRWLDVVRQLDAEAGRN